MLKYIYNTPYSYIYHSTLCRAYVRAQVMLKFVISLDLNKGDREGHVYSTDSISSLISLSWAVKSSKNGNFTSKSSVLIKTFSICECSTELSEFDTSVLYNWDGLELVHKSLGSGRIGWPRTQFLFIHILKQEGKIMRPIEYATFSNTFRILNKTLYFIKMKYI